MRRFQQYCSEMLFCLRMGADFQTKIKLLYAVWRLHFLNFLGEKGDRRTNDAVCYRIKLKQGIHPVWMRPGSGDIFIFLEVFQLRAYEFADPNQISIKQIVDLGANIGLTSLWFLQYWPSAKCICVEPNPSNLALLKKNVGPFALQVEIVEGAVDSVSGIKSFKSDSWSYGGKLEAGGDLRVECFTVNDLMARYQISQIDMLKIDIEGAEAQLFADQLNWLKRAKYLLMELHGTLTKDHVLEKVKPLGFQDLKIGDNHSDFVVAENSGYRV